MLQNKATSLQTPLGELIQRSSRPVAVFKGPTSKEMEMKGKQTEVEGNVMKSVKPRAREVGLSSPPMASLAGLGYMEALSVT